MSCKNNPHETHGVFFLKFLSLAKSLNIVLEDNTKIRKGERQGPVHARARDSRTRGCNLYFHFADSLGIIRFSWAPMGTDAGWSAPPTITDDNYNLWRATHFEIRYDDHESRRDLLEMLRMLLDKSSPSPRPDLLRLPPMSKSRKASRLPDLGDAN